MEAAEDNSSANTSLKRQRATLAETGDNLLSLSDVNDGQKRPRLESRGQENRTPRASPCGRGAELLIKPDTPMVPSVQQRVQQLAQKGDVAQHCLLDGSTSLSSKHHQHLLSEADFHQRMERFKGPLFRAGPDATPSPGKPRPLNLSNIVSGIQQKLHGDATPSSKQASRIRQEREQELNQLNLQPIRDNAWLKRSSSDSSLCQVDADMKDGSFTSGAHSSSPSDVDLSSHDDTNTADIIDQMFEEVLEYAEKLEERRSSNEGEKDGAHIESEREEEKEEEEDQVDAKKEECEDELFLPTTSILSPLSKSIEAVVTPLRLDAGAEANPPSLLLTPDETTSPLYSVDAYRTQRQSKMAATIQSVTPRVQRRAPDKPQPGSSTNSKERIATLNEEAAKLQIVINQTLQALSCCTDEEHGRGSLEEAEAEKLLLVSCEKRSACLAEAARLRDGRSSSSSGEDDVTQQPCRATVTITNIQLPLKVEFVCSSYNRSAANHQPSHYFFILIRYGACNIVATPLATAADAQNGDTISFPTCVTLKDIASTFHIDVEVYSLSHTLGTITGMERSTARSRVTPRKLLNTLTKASSTLTSAAVPAFSTHRSSNFTLVGSHKITLASLGHRKFALDKMKLDGKVRKLLGDEFQEKVPFLSPLEGSIYLQVDSQSHSCVQHQGFLTMFELLSGFGVWHRRYFTLDGCTLHYWNHPNDKESKEAEGVISLSSSPNRCVRPVKRDSCARPFTFELVSSLPQDDNQESFSKRWFSADTKQERLDWMEKLNQALLDFHTWKPAASIPVQPSDTSRGNLRESIL
uniref:anillin, actin binding protein 2 isoform X5 n=1 Tax=Doryrhamphus excisus TaxID=161450 RepID=UPI0025AE8B0B|nr:anillin, actin binding protein 2 isoform X5 [Doryrhamphus excisus]